jgi:deazaflavin-dependent oxidoreductase (nitroreductase family)
MGTIIALVGALALGLLFALGVFVGGMRAGWPPVVDRVRHMNRRYLNPRQMESAGTPGAFAGILRHTGRTTGMVYETPLGIERTDDGFVIALVYGPRSQWVQNVRAAGHATVVLDGQSHEVDRPEVVPYAEVADAFTSSDRAMGALFGTTHCLRLRLADTAA